MRQTKIVGWRLKTLYLLSYLTDCGSRLPSERDLSYSLTQNIVTGHPGIGTTQLHTQDVKFDLRIAFVGLADFEVIDGAVPSLAVDGFLEKLSTMNIAGNNISFPPAHIIQSGPVAIKKWLIGYQNNNNQSLSGLGHVKSNTSSFIVDRSCLGRLKRISSAPNLNQSHEPFQLQRNCLTSAYPSCEDLNSKTTSCDDFKSLNTTSSDVERGQFTSSLYRTIRRNYLDRRRKKEKSKLPCSQSERHFLFLPDEQPIPNPDRIVANDRYMKKMHCLKRLNAEKEKHVQQIKDVITREDWVEQCRKMKNAKCRIYADKAGDDIKLESAERIVSAPFDTLDTQLRVINSQDLHFTRQQTLKPSPPPANMTDADRINLDAACSQRDVRLLQQIASHMEDVTVHCNNSVPEDQANRYQAMVSAKKDIDKAVALYQRVHRRLNTMLHFHGSNRRDLW